LRHGSHCGGHLLPRVTTESFSAVRSHSIFNSCAHICRTPRSSSNRLSLPGLQRCLPCDQRGWQSKRPRLIAKGLDGVITRHTPQRCNIRPSGLTSCAFWRHPWLLPADAARFMHLREHDSRAVCRFSGLAPLDDGGAWTLPRLIAQLDGTLRNIAGFSPAAALL